MADTEKTILSVVATTSNKLSDLPIKNGQLVFVHDRQKIALDYDNKRKFYNQLEMLENESDRLGLEAPAAGLFYFVVSTAVLWTYRDGWIQVTTPPSNVIFIGTELPELGSGEKLYVNDQGISIWDDELKQYVVVANKTDNYRPITDEEIHSLFEVL